MTPREPYRVELVTEVYPTCERGAAFGIVYQSEVPGPEVALGLVYLTFEEATAMRDRLNAAYFQGVEVGRQFGLDAARDQAALEAISDWAATFNKGNH